SFVRKSVWQRSPRLRPSAFVRQANLILLPGPWRRRKSELAIAETAGRCHQGRRRRRIAATVTHFPDSYAQTTVETKPGLSEETTMANVFVEARPKGRPEGDPIDDYVVEDHADHVLKSFKTQQEAIEWARENGHSPHVARVRHLNEPDPHRRATFARSS